MDGLALVLGPLLTQVPPRLGSKRPADLIDQLKVVAAQGARRPLQLRRGPALPRWRADLLREWFETEAMQGAMGVNGIIGTWAGPDAGHGLRPAAPLDRRCGRRRGRLLGLPPGRHGRWGPARSVVPRNRSGARCAPTLRSSGCSCATARSSVSHSSTAGRSRPRWWSPPSTPRSASSATSSRGCSPTTSSTTSAAGARGRGP